MVPHQMNYWPEILKRKFKETSHLIPLCGYAHPPDPSLSPAISPGPSLRWHQRHQNEEWFPNKHHLSSALAKPCRNLVPAVPAKTAPGRLPSYCPDCDTRPQRGTGKGVPRTPQSAPSSAPLLLTGSWKTLLKT